MKSKNIIGRGFIGKSLNSIKKLIKKKGFVIYAAGISNSKIDSKKELKREIKLFRSFAVKNYLKKVIFISTTDVTHNLTNRSEYVKNKINIENLIKRKFKYYIIVRLPQIIGKTRNNNTLIQNFYHKIKYGKKIIILKKYKRNILDIDDVLKALKVILKTKSNKNTIITLSNKYFINPIDIVRIFEKKLNKKAKYLFKESPKQIWPLNYEKNSKYFKKANVRFNRNYLLKKINKYY